MNLKATLREPMLHFVVIGIAFFAIHSWLAPSEANVESVVVRQSAIDDLARQYQSAWGKPPTETELANLVETHVRDEILYREGLALGLDRDDQVIKRRVRQKLEIMSEEAVATSAPTDADLSAYLARHPEQFVRPGLVSFEQIFFDGSASVEEVNNSVAAARLAVSKGVDTSTLGKASMLPRRKADVELDLVAREFGEAFADQLAKAPIGEWIGPVASGFGAHLVLVTARTPGGIPRLADVRPLVQREWEHERRTRSRNEAYDRLRKKYEVVIERNDAGVTP